MEIIKELISKPFDSIWNTLEIEVKQIVSNRLLEYQVEEFDRNYYTKTIVHRTEPVKLHDFYQPLYIRRYGRNYYDEKISTTDCVELFNDNNFITLIGTAGSGKSTIVKSLLVNSIETKFKIPIKIELRYLNTYDGNLIKYINEEIFKLSQLAFDQKIINRLLQSGNFLIFFDGYDELSSTVKDDVTKSINDITKIYNKNSYVITSRPYTNIELLSKFRNYIVCDLNSEEMEAFVRKQLPINEKETATKIIEAITNDGNETYKSYLGNPLLLSMFILTYQTYSNVPPKKSTFYRQVFDSLFYLHDSVSKLSWTREKKSGLSKEQFEYVLQLFSFISFFKEIFAFEEDFINNTLNQIKEKKKSLIFENNLLLEDLQVAICILNKEGLDYVFPHRSLQEYFASLYIVNLDPKNKNEVYKRVLDQLLNNDTFEMMSKENFYTLLTEQDYLGVIKNLSIPFLEKISEDIKTISEKERINSVLRGIQNFIFSFHSGYSFTQPLFNLFQNFMLDRHQVISKAIKRSKGEKIELSKAENTQLQILNDNLFKELKILLPKTIKELKIYLRDETKSDSSIIDLI
jgi:hypothetical protein